MARPTRPRFIARSRAMRALDEQIRRFADSDSNVLIAGETGTGKNAVATELHARGPRAKRPFVAIDCASLSTTLIDSELFGHERGAFTDAVTARAGRFELAGNGTVYLDAVTELPVEAQGKLLRIVEEKRVERLGGHASMPVSARIVASADARIEDAVRASEFRHDLYHRLRVLPIFLPPLRERADDVLPLARYFLARLAAATRRDAPALSREAAAALRDYAWPGNVRELQHTVQRAFEASGSATIALQHLPDEVLEAPSLYASEALAHRPTLDEVEQRYIASTLRHVRGNQTEAARILGISRKALWEKRKRYGLE
jgi:DNA-binding NtrC family response regulator